MRRNTIYPYMDVQKHYLTWWCDKWRWSPRCRRWFWKALPPVSAESSRKEITQCNFVEVKNNWAKSVWLAADQLWTMLYIIRFTRKRRICPNWWNLSGEPLIWLALNNVSCWWFWTKLLKLKRKDRKEMTQQTTIDQIKCDGTCLVSLSDQLWTMSLFCNYL